MNGLREERGQALILAMAALPATSLLAAGIARTAWDGTRSPLQSRLRSQATIASASASELQLAVLKRALREQLVQNILDQGCKRQNDAGTQCVVPGNDTGGTSGVRKDRIQRGVRWRGRQPLAEGRGEDYNQAGAVGTIGECWPGWCRPRSSKPAGGGQSGLSQVGSIPIYSR